MVGAPFPGRHLARDLIASVEDALQTPPRTGGDDDHHRRHHHQRHPHGLLAYSHKTVEFRYETFVTNSDDHHTHHHHHHDHYHSRASALSPTLETIHQY